MKYKDKTNKFNACSVASKNCKLGGWCSWRVIKMFAPCQKRRYKEYEKLFDN